MVEKLKVNIKKIKEETLKEYFGTKDLSWVTEPDELTPEDVESVIEIAIKKTIKEIIG